MTHYIRSGNTVNIADNTAFDVFDKLPTATYTVKYNEFTDSYFFQVIDDFKLPAKLYGDIQKTCSRIWRTFNERPNGTGALLGGEKGSGKTLLTKLLSAQGAKHSVPTIVVNEPYFGETFNQFIQHIDQDAIVLFDEFEKVYPAEAQESILTLLDGVYPTKKLYLLTVNNQHAINSHMVNRPGRLYYRIQYSGLGADFIREYCQDTLLNKEHVESVVRLSSLYGAFNFDMLQALVEESNRYDEHPAETIKVLNAKPESSDSTEYSVEVTLNGVAGRAERDTIKLNPSRQFNFYAYFDKTAVKAQNRSASEKGVDELLTTLKDDDDDEFEGLAGRSVVFEPADFEGVDQTTGNLVFSNSRGYRAVLTKVVRPAYDYSSAMF